MLSYKSRVKKKKKKRLIRPTKHFYSLRWRFRECKGEGGALVSLTTNRKKNKTNVSTMGSQRLYLFDFDEFRLRNATRTNANLQFLSSEKEKI